MSLTDLQASDEINALVSTAWDGATALVGPNNELRYKGKSERTNPPSYWGRVSQQIVAQPTASMADENTFGSARKRYETFGLVFVQVFAAKSDANAHRKGFQLSELVRDAFRRAGQSGSVWYENARINPLTDDGSNYRWNVVAEFRYDTID